MPDPGIPGISGIGGTARGSPPPRSAVRSLPRVLRRAVDRVLAVIANTALRLLFRSIEIEGLEHLPRHRPMLVVANHFNGFVDPVLLVRGLHRLPRFLAKATLWDVVVARPFLALAGIIPVHRPEDHEGASGNTSTFRTCHEVLAEGAVVALFPEGTTHDRPSLDKVRTGAARIALGAKAAGVEGLMIVPVGLVFDDKLALRSRAAVRVGAPIDIDEEIGDCVQPGGEVSEENRDAVRRLTGEIDEHLRRVAPEYDSVREREVFGRAADVALRTSGMRPGQRVPLIEREELGQRLAGRSETDRTAVADATAHYQLDLDLANLSDADVVERQRVGSLLARAIAATVLAVVLAPIAAVGIAVNIIPYWIVSAVGRRVVVPVTKGTVRLLTAIIVFPLSWIAWSLWAEWPSWEGLFLSFVLSPLAGLVAVFMLEYVARVWRSWRAWGAVRERKFLLGPLREQRQVLVDLVDLVDKA